MELGKIPKMRNTLRYGIPGMVLILALLSVGYWLGLNRNSPRMLSSEPEKTRADDGVWFRPSQQIVVKEDTLLPPLDSRTVWLEVIRSDQRVRDSFHIVSQRYPEHSPETKRAWRSLQATDEKNRRIAIKLLGKEGWPRRSVYGAAIADAPFYVALHSSGSPGFQEKCLKLMEELLRDHEVNVLHYAILADRISLLKNGIQLYGTHQIIKGSTHTYEPWDNIDSVDQRRKQLGLPALENAGVEMGWMGMGAGLAPN